MYATAAPQTGVPTLDYATAEVLYRLRNVAHRLSMSKATLERAYLRGQEEAVSQILDSLYSIADFDAADWERTFQLRMLVSLLNARHKGEKMEAHKQSQQRFNSIEWHQLVRGRLESYQWGIGMLRELGLTPLR